MSTLNVDKVDPSTGTALEIGTSGDTINVPSGVTLDINSGATLDATGATVTGAIGKIGQVLSDTKTDTTSISSATFAQISGLTIDITPSATSCKILCLVTALIGNNSTATYLRLMRDTTSIFESDASGNIPQATTGCNIGQYVLNPFPVVYLDSPSSTSAITYSLYWRSDGTELAYLNRSLADRDTANYDPRGVSSITVMEVLA